MSKPWIVPGAPLENGAGWRIWICAAGRNDFAPPSVRVTLAGQAQPLAGPPNWRLLPAVNGLDRRAGVLTVALQTPAPGKWFDVELQDGNGTSAFRWPSLPDKIDDKGVTFLFGSCFWQNNDREGAFLRAVDFLTKKFQPSWKFLIGDQSYQDYPLVGLTTDPVAALAGRYGQYWGDGKFLEALQATPNFFMCDDHEFWNDYPEKQVQLWQTRIDAVADKFGKAALNLYETFQSCMNPSQPWYEFAVGKVSFFVADTRSKRQKAAQPGAQFFEDSQWTALETWASSLQGPGVLVLGQPMFQKDGDWKDHSLSNFPRDYGRLAAVIEDAQAGKSGAPHHILMLSGDIHTGRYSRATIADFQPGGTEERDFSAVHEFVASPSSLVGPYYPGRQPSISFPPARLPVKEYNGPRPHWDIDTVKGASADNNIGLIRMSLGPADSVRFDLSLYRVRPFDDRSAWDRLRGAPPPQSTVQEFFTTAIKLS
jgi:hypothetical protein